ncbi:hypothetical protein M378DRAFT_364497 [Amanita muscaria Koide BX008]|uniref:Uncharacterized protein n=1 Tax=Amanita muscaria (strain Koide BX008) TaxID=946122 RepID=A0A0C2SUK2_AMAMK|nr:hypothetical protein M378DRAFT_364497 [Amanita muscaria Koide BX008]
MFILFDLWQTNGPEYCGSLTKLAESVKEVGCCRRQWLLNCFMASTAESRTNEYVNRCSGLQSLYRPSLGTRILLYPWAPKWSGISPRKGSR